MSRVHVLATAALLSSLTSLTAAVGGDTYSSTIVGGLEPADGSPPTTNLAIGVVANANTPKSQPVVNGGPMRMVR